MHISPVLDNLTCLNWNVLWIHSPLTTEEWGQLWVFSGLLFFFNFIMTDISSEVLKYHKRTSKISRFFFSSSSVTYYFCSCSSIIFEASGKENNILTVFIWIYLIWRSDTFEALKYMSSLCWNQGRMKGMFRLTRGN